MVDEGLSAGDWVDNARVRDDVPGPRLNSECGGRTRYRAVETASLDGTKSASADWLDNASDPRVHGGGLRAVGSRDLNPRCERPGFGGSPRIHGDWPRIRPTNEFGAMDCTKSPFGDWMDDAIIHGAHDGGLCAFTSRDLNPRCERPGFGGSPRIHGDWPRIRPRNEFGATDGTKSASADWMDNAIILPVSEGTLRVV
jgi:hypothetical protein